MTQRTLNYIAYTLNKVKLPAICFVSEFKFSNCWICALLRQMCFKRSVLVKKIIVWI